MMKSCGRFLCERQDETIMDKRTFAVLNDIHSRVQLYPQLVTQGHEPVNFVVLNGDVLDDSQSKEQVVESLLLPMAWLRRSRCRFFCARQPRDKGWGGQAVERLSVAPRESLLWSDDVWNAPSILLDSGEDKLDSHGTYSGLVDFDAYWSGRSPGSRRNSRETPIGGPCGAS